MSSLKGPIVLIEDDPDDRDLFHEVCRELQVKNELKFFRGCAEALYYLADTNDKPLLIISDINLPGMNGIEFRRKIVESDYLALKSIPFVFLTTSSREEYVLHAYKMKVQGYFLKPASMEELKQIIKKMIDYWMICRHPNME